MISVISAVLILGLSGMVSQIVLLRELLVVFSGNELYIGLFIGLWAFGEALGALLGERFTRLTQAHGRLYPLMTAIFSAIFPGALLLARNWKYFGGIPVEISSGIGVMSGVAALVLLPVAIIHGFLFIAACRVVKDARPECDNSVGLTYSWETTGTIIGGILTGFALLNRLNSFDIALLIALVNALACMALPAENRKESRYRVALAAVIGLVSALLLFSGYGKLLHEDSIGRQWAGRKIVSYQNSHYQNIVVVETSGQYTIFTDGLSHISLPVSDIEHIEELAHFPLLMHPAPKSVLIVGGGAGGMISEMLKHPSVKTIDYLEPDPALIGKIAQLQGSISVGELDDPKVSLINQDARVFLRKTSKRYDAVIINTPLPETLQANRIFTSQFFASLKAVLNDDGLLALPVRGSTTYYSPELKQLNASIFATLKAVFANVEVIPGDSNLFLAGKASIPARDAALASGRLAERAINTRLISAEHLAYRFAESGESWDLPKNSSVAINEDFYPSLLYQNLSYGSLVHTTVIAEILGSIGRLNAALVAVITIMAIIAATVYIGNSRRSSISLAVAATGMSAMIAELLLMAVFQVFYGSLFHMMGMLLAVFMAGIGLGSYCSTVATVRRIADRKIMLRLEVSMVLLLLGQVLFLSGMEHNVLEPVRLPLLLAGIALTGLLTGMTYPVASRLYKEAGGNVLNPGTMEGVAGAGFIYAVDLLGGCAGGVIGGMVLLPALGMKGSFLMLVLIKASTALIFFRIWRACPVSTDQ